MNPYVQNLFICITIDCTAELPIPTVNGFAWLTQCNSSMITFYLIQQCFDIQ